MSGSPSIIRKINGGKRPRSNQELVNSLRDNFVATRLDYALVASPATANGANTLPSPPQTPIELWTERDEKTLYIPRINWEAAGLREEANDYEITVKLFLLPGTTVQDREQYAREALDLVRKELGIQAIDLLIVSFPGMSFEGTCEKEAERINAEQGNLDEELASWKVFEDLHNQGLAKRLGVAEFGSEKLRAFLQQTAVRPTVDQVNLQDCCNVPQPLLKLAEEERGAACPYRLHRYPSSRHLARAPRPWTPGRRSAGRCCEWRRRPRRRALPAMGCSVRCVCQGSWSD